MLALVFIVNWLVLAEFKFYYIDKLGVYLIGTFGSYCLIGLVSVGGFTFSCSAIALPLSIFCILLVV
jgi:hypothetical protein